MIRKILRDDGYKLKEEGLQLSTLTKACQLVNDRVTIRAPIHIKLVETLLFETERMFPTQMYLQILYKTIMIVAYYGLFRIGELTFGPHVVKARNVEVGQNKNKIRIILFTSKTHALESRPQIVKISEIEDTHKMRVHTPPKRCCECFFCPFKLIKSYIKLRGSYLTDTEPFFIFRDRQPIRPNNIRVVLAKLVSNIGLDQRCFTFHGLHSGRASDLLKLGYSIDQIKRFGRWKSNAVYKYIK